MDERRQHTADRPIRARRDPARAVAREVERAASGLGLEGHGVLAAVSGGLDSAVLAEVLAETARRSGFRLAIGHVHHGLRGADADADEAAVRAQADRLGVAFASERIAPRAWRQGGSSRARPTLQEAARTLRYAALARLAERLGSDRIATAHHADDQAETVLLRLFRGSGPDGLGGIPERSPDGRVVRPLLRLSRAEIEAFARARGLGWRDDASNASLEYARNRLRRRWLPGLVRDFNPRLLRAVADLAEAQRRDSEWIAACVEVEACRRLEIAGGWLHIDTAGWSELPEALARRLVREALCRAGVARHVERVHLERVLRFVARPRADRTVQLPAGLELRSGPAGVRIGPLPSASTGSGGFVC